MSFIQISKIQEPVPITVFQIMDNLNMGNTDELVKEARQAFQSGARKIILDLAGIQFLSSTGIRGLMMVHRIFNSEELEKNDLQAINHLRICNCSPYIFKTLEIAGLTESLGVCDHLEEAVTALSI